MSEKPASANIISTPLTTPDRKTFETVKVIDPALPEFRVSNPVERATQQPTKQAADRQVFANAETKETPRRPEIKDLGPVVAFFVEPPVHLSSEAMVNYINEARRQGIIISPTSEGRKFVGFIQSTDQASYLGQLGNLSLGLVGSETSSFIHIDPQNEVWVEGCTSIIAAARAIHDAERKGVTASMLAQEDEVDAITGYKNTRMKEMPLGDVNYPPFPPDVPPEAFKPMETKKIKKESFPKLYAVKVDVNNFSETFARATKEGQIELNQDLIIFFNQIAGDLKKNGVLLGEQTTDSLEFYFKDLHSKKRMEEILAKAIKEHGFSIKAVGTTLKDVELTSYNGRVIHSSAPIEERVWASKEKLVKKAIADNALYQQEWHEAFDTLEDRLREWRDSGQITEDKMQETINRFTSDNPLITREDVESHIFFRYSRRSDKLGFTLPEAA